MRNLKKFNENKEDWSQSVNGTPSKKQKVFGVPNGSSYGSKMNQLNNLLEEGWSIINVSKMEGNSNYAGGLIYILEK